MKEVLTLIGIGPATETVARVLGTDRQLVLADLQVASHATPEDSSDAPSRPASAAEDLAKVLRRAGIKSRSTRVDLSDAESVEALIQYAERLGQPAGAWLLDPAPGAASPIVAIDLAATAHTLQQLPPLARNKAAPVQQSSSTQPPQAPQTDAAPANPPAPQAVSQPLPASVSGQKALIVCFSPSGNTETLAWLIQKYTNADVAELKPLMLYPRDYKNALEQVKLENELNYLPKLGKFEADVASCPLIYLGFPVWDAQLPPPVKTWLSQTDLAGKTIVPFTTHAGPGEGEAFGQISQLCPASTVLPGLSLVGNTNNETPQNALRGRRAAEAEQQVQAWLGIPSTR
jgi:flavodoxin